MPVTPLATDPIVTQSRAAFSLACRVEVALRASADRVWAVLTDAQGFPRWNSTVTAIEGEIREGQQIRIHAPGTTRTFSPLITDVVAHTRMTWTGGVAPLFKGVRTFELSPRTDGATTFVMQERFSGLLIPIVGRSLPDFGPIFARYATDLQREAER
jgi:hypothetical protein